MKYRCKIDCPWGKKGEIKDGELGLQASQYQMGATYITFNFSPKDYPDLFEPAEEFWEPGKAESFYYIDDFNVRSDIRCDSNDFWFSKRDSGAEFFIFRTKEKAEAARDEILEVLRRRRERV